MPMNAFRHAGQEQRITTPVCSRPASEWFPRYAVGSWTPLPLSDSRCSWVVPTYVFLLVSNAVGLWCCPALCGWHSDPSPSPSYDDGLPALLVTTGEKFLVGDGLRPENMQDYHFSATAGVQDCRSTRFTHFYFSLSIAGLHVTSRRPCWGSRTKAFLSSGN